ncbi:MAG: hypothetical protein ACK5V3_02605 [Bdellovibrionales bacterium]
MKSIALVVSLVLAFTAQAQLKKSAAPISFASSTTHEVELTVGQISLISAENPSNGDRETNITIYGAYNKDWQNNMQWGFEGGILPLPDGADTKSVLAAMGTVTYNLDSNYRNSFFGIGGVGLYPAWDKDGTGGEYKSAFSLFAGFGKRIEMWGKINYKPYIRVWKKGEEDMSFEIQALNFSIFY